MNPRFSNQAFPLSGVVALGLLLTACGGSKAPEPRPLPTPKPPDAAAVDSRYEKLPEPSKAPDWDPPNVRTVELASKMRLWHVEARAVPLVSIQLALPLGSASDPKGYEGLTLLAADLLDEGAGKRTALELSDELDRLATDYSAQTGVDHVLLSMNSLGENLDESLALLADIVQRPQLSKAEFERRREHHVAAAIAAKAEPQSRMTEAVSRVLFGTGYAGAPARGSEESLRKLDLARVKAQVRRMAVPDGAHLVLAGDVTSEEAEALVAKHFGAWRGTRTETPVQKGDASPPGHAYVVDFPGAAQSSLSVVRPAGGALDPAYFAEMVMNQKVGETFTSRINLNLREDKGYTYGAFSRFQRYRHAGYFTVTSSVLTETTAKSVAEIFSELESLCGSRPLTPREHREAVDGLLLGYPSQFSSVDALGTRIVSLPIFGRKADFYSTWAESVGSVDLASANRAAAPYCDRKNYSVVIAGDLLKIGPELEKLGLPIVTLDRDGMPAKKPVSSPK